MRKKLTQFLLGAVIFTMTVPSTVLAAPAESVQVETNVTTYQTDAAAETEFSDGCDNPEIPSSFNDGSFNTLAATLAEQTEAQARKTLEEKATAEKAAANYRLAEEKKLKVRAGKAKLEKARKKKAAAEKARLEKRYELVNFALQFEGNPYVYGGTSLTNGADCSGFVMSVFAEFGYELPRVADAQCSSATPKDLSNLEVGDLLFYGDYGINHVALYIGNGQIIHASTAATGIKISDYDYRQPTAAGSYLF